MKLMIICSKHFYNRIPPIEYELKIAGHVITLPNSYDEPFKEEEVKKLSPLEHVIWKQSMMKLHEPKIRKNDAVLVLNYEKNGQENYIGGGTFMEIVKAWELNKGIYLYHPIPYNIFEDELRGINPTIINENLALIK
jgi:hypothetical protein